MLERLRNRFQDARLRRDLHRQSAAWLDLGGLLGDTTRREDAWEIYSVRRRELVDEIVPLVVSNAPLGRVVRDLGLSRMDLREAYRSLVRHSSRPWALEPGHLPTMLMLQPAWLEAVGALYLAGRLEGHVGDLEEALIATDDTYPLSVLEVLVLPGWLVNARTA